MFYQLGHHDWLVAMWAAAFVGYIIFPLFKIRTHLWHFNLQIFSAGVAASLVLALL